MPRAYGDDLAWRVVWRLVFVWRLWEEVVPRHIAADVSDDRHGLAVSIHYVRDVWSRFWWSGEVATHQGRREAPPWNKAFSLVEDMALIDSLVAHPRWQIKEHCAAYNADTGKTLSYVTYLRAVWRLGFSRQKIRSVCYKADRDKAHAWLTEVLTFYALWQLLCVDETSKDLSVLKGSYGYAMRGKGCECYDLPALSHGKRTSAVVVFSPQHGFLDWAFTSGTFNTEYFVHVTTENFVDWRGVVRSPVLLSHVGPATAVLMDGASIHKNKDARLEARLAAKNAKLIIIPPYCWFLSPLDHGAFGQLVLFLRANSSLVVNAGIEAACEQGFMTCLSDEGVRKCWLQCGYTRLY